MNVIDSLLNRGEINTNVNVELTNGTLYRLGALVLAVVFISIVINKLIEKI